MRVELIGARVFAHGITEDEMRAVVDYPIIVSRVEQRRPGSDPHIFVRRFDENEPPVEVGAVVCDIAGQRPERRPRR